MPVTKKESPDTHENAELLGYAGLGYEGIKPARGIVGPNFAGFIRTWYQLAPNLHKSCHGCQAMLRAEKGAASFWATRTGVLTQLRL